MFVTSPLFLLPLLALIAVITFGSLRYWRSMWSNVFTVFLACLIIPVLITSQADAAVFVIALVLGYVTDIIGVYTGEWRYMTKSGYYVLVGLGWAVLSVIIFHLWGASWAVTVLLLLCALVTIIFRKKQHLPITLPRSLYFSSHFIFLFLFPKLFLLGFSVGIILEFIAVEVFKVWKYKELSYIYIGLGYAELMCIIAICLQVVSGKFLPLHLGAVAVIAILYIYANARKIAALLHYKKKPKKKGK